MKYINPITLEIEEIKNNIPKKDYVYTITVEKLADYDSIFTATYVYKDFSTGLKALKQLGLNYKKELRRKYKEDELGVEEDVNAEKETAKYEVYLVDDPFEDDYVKLKLEKQEVKTSI